MTDNEIKSNLCHYDGNNPYSILDLFEDDDRPEPRNGCACDNCFYGRDKLAVQILEKRRERDEARAESLEQSRLLGMSGEREAKLLAQLAVERALADRLAGQLDDCLQSQEDIGWVMQALTAWKEARND